jgi:general secretion pathway protein G
MLQESDNQNRMPACPTVRHATRGFSLIELLVVLAVIGILSTIVVPQLINGFERSRQRRTLADMRAISGANGAFRVDFGDYADALTDLEPDYLSPSPPADAWGHSWTYQRNGEDYFLTSPGRDGAGGPAPPDPWYDEPFEADLILQNGSFTQVPGSER